MARFASIRATRILVGGSIAAWMYLLFLVIGPSVEAKFFPVVKFEEVVQRRDGNRIWVDATFDKLRACEYSGSQWYVRSALGLRDAPAQVAYHNSPEGTTRPPGKAYDRGWEVILPTDDMIGPAYDRLLLVINYHCGWPWITQAIIGPYKLAGAQ